MRVWRPRGAVACAELRLPAGRPDDVSACWEQLDQARVFARTEARLAGMVKRMHTRYAASTHGRIAGSQQPAHRLAAFKSDLQLGDPIEAPLRLDEVIVWCDGESPSRSR